MKPVDSLIEALQKQDWELARDLVYDVKEYVEAKGVEWIEMSFHYRRLRATFDGERWQQETETGWEDIPTPQESKIFKAGLEAAHKSNEA